jgi:predicted outer membrane repeat protein
MLRNYFALKDCFSSISSFANYRQSRKPRALRRAGRGIMETLEQRILLSTFTVSNMADDGSLGTLRWAVARANNAGGTNTINFQSGLTGTITLTSGALDLISGNLTIEGPAADSLDISGNNAGAVFVVFSGEKAAFSGLTISNGSAVNGAGIYNGGPALTINSCTFSGDAASGNGGAIYNATHGTLTITDSTFSGNTAALDGGAIYNLYSHLTIGTTTFQNNSATDGGAIFDSDSAVVTVTSSMLSDNSASNTGGAIDSGNGASLSVTGSSFSGNSATNNNGGGIANASALTVFNCEFDSDSANNGYGGGIFSTDKLTVTSGAFSEDTSNGGGGIYCSGTLTLASSNFNIDQSTNKGGGIENQGTSTVATSTFTSNAAKYHGGGIWNDGNIKIQGCTISGNTAGDVGAGFYNAGTATLTNCTLYGNSAVRNGGGIWNLTALTATNCTIVGNSAASGGGIEEDSEDNSDATITLHNTIVAGNTELNQTTPDDISPNNSVSASSSFNLIGTGGSGGLTSGVNGNIVGVADAKLGPLQYNGGPNETMALLPGSPAIDKGSNALALDALGKPLTSDQRGSPFVRISNGKVDIGAFEVQPDPSQLYILTQPTNVVAGAKIEPSVVVIILDVLTNHLVGTDDSNVTLRVSSGPGTLGGTVTVVALNGVATFSNLIITKAGTGYVLSATDGIEGGTTSSTFNVTPAAAAKLAFTSQPVGTSAGKNLSPSVAVSIEDAFGNIVTTNTSKITLATKTGPGAIFGTAAVNAIAGVAHFAAVDFHIAGTYTVGATDTGLTAAISAGFKITAGAVAHLAFVQNPTNVVAGVNIAPNITVKATDAYGNVVAGATVKLAIGSGPVGGGLFGSFTATTSPTGIATFGGLSLHKAGAYTLTASFGAIVSPKSTAFTVSAAKASKLVFTTLPVGAKHGTGLIVKVSVEDSFGNVLLADNTGTITLALGATHPVGAVLAGTKTANVGKGVATFANITVNLAGTYSLLATDSFGVAAATSAAFVVS